MNIVFLGSPAIVLRAKSVVIVADEFDFSVALTVDPQAIGVFMCGDRSAGHTLVRNIRVDGIKNPLYCLMHGEQADHTMVAAILNAGADQVERFPVDSDLFKAQIEAVVRRGAGNPDPIIRFGGMEFNLYTRRLTGRGREVRLTRTEANIFYAIVAAQGQTMSKRQIFESVWGIEDDVPEIKIVDVLICKIRRKMTRFSGGLDFVKTVWGEGYRFLQEGFTPSIRNTVAGPQRFEIERTPLRQRIGEPAE